jgi:hypothetical protein
MVKVGLTRDYLKNKNEPERYFGRTEIIMNKVKITKKTNTGANEVPRYAEDAVYKTLVEICESAGYPISYSEDANFSCITAHDLVMPNYKGYEDDILSSDGPCESLAHKLAHKMLENFLFNGDNCPLQHRMRNALWTDIENVYLHCNVISKALFAFAKNTAFCKDSFISCGTHDTDKNKKSKYDFVETFYDNVAVVGNGDKRGVINKNGDLIVPIIYDFIIVYEDGTIEAEVGDAVVYMNTAGELIDEPSL